MPPKKGTRAVIQRKITPAGKGSALPEVRQQPKRNAAKKQDDEFFAFFGEEDVSDKKKGEQLPL
jgi:hypothetical protein